MQNAGKGGKRLHGSQWALPASAAWHLPQSSLVIPLPWSNPRPRTLFLPHKSPPILSCYFATSSQAETLLVKGVFSLSGPCPPVPLHPATKSLAAHRSAAAAVNRARGALGWPPEPHLLLTQPGTAAAAAYVSPGD